MSKLKSHSHILVCHILVCLLFHHQTVQFAPTCIHRYAGCRHIPWGFIAQHITIIDRKSTCICRWHRLYEFQSTIISLCVMPLLSPSLSFTCRFELKIRYLPKNLNALFRDDHVTYFFYYDQVRKRYMIFPHYSCFKMLCSAKYWFHVIWVYLQSCWRSDNLNL